MKKTPFYEKHLEYGGKMVEFAGYSLPIQYGKGVLEECRRVRNTVGVFDVSHMGEIEIRGRDSLEFVNYVTTNDASSLDLYQVQYSSFCYQDGGLVDDLLIYRLPDRYFIVVNASNVEKDYEWLLQNQRGEVEILNRSEEVGQLAIQGPRAEEVMKDLVNIDLSQMRYYWGAEASLLGIPLLISRTGYTGEDGFEVYCKPEEAHRIWDGVFDSGKKWDIEPVALAARDTLRLEVNYCLYGNDIDQSTTPLEAGLGWITKLSKKDFIGCEVLREQKEKGVRRRLVSFEMLEKGVPRHHYEIQVDGEKVGYVTSGNFSPSCEKFVGMGYVNKPYGKEDTNLEILIRGNLAKARVVKPPFYKKGTRK
jgi:aminomethyltransferase